jgi:hypothetical protein
MLSCRIIQSLGLAMGIAGLGLGFAIAGGWDGKYGVHRNLGVAAVVLGVLQVCIADLHYYVKLLLSWEAGFALNGGLVSMRSGTPAWVAHLQRDG